VHPGFPKMPHSGAWCLDLERPPRLEYNARPRR
jgi:hypothetical protein